MRMPTSLHSGLWCKVLGVALLVTLLSATLWLAHTRADGPGVTHAAATVEFDEDGLSAAEDGVTLAGNEIHLRVTFRDRVQRTLKAYVWVRVVRGSAHESVTDWIYAGACRVQPINTLNRSCLLSVSPQISEVGEYFLHWWVGDVTGRHPWSLRMASTRLSLSIMPQFEVDLISDFDCPSENEGGVLDAIFDLGRALWRGFKKQDPDLCDLIALNDTEAVVYSIASAVSDVSGVGDFIDAERCLSEGCPAEDALLVGAGFIAGAGDLSKAYRKYRKLPSGAELSIRTAKAARFTTVGKLRKTKLYQSAKRQELKDQLEGLANNVRRNCVEGRTFTTSCLRPLGELQAAFDLHDLGYTIKSGQTTINIPGRTPKGRQRTRRVDWVVKDQRGQVCLVEVRSRTNSASPYITDLMDNAQHAGYRCAMMHIRPTASNVTSIGDAFSGRLPVLESLGRWGRSQTAATQRGVDVDLTVIGRRGANVVQIKPDG